MSVLPKNHRARRVLVAALVLLVPLSLLGGYLAWWKIPEVAAKLLLCPPRSLAQGNPPPGVEAVTYSGDDVSLRGWRKSGVEPHCGTILYLHGLCDNRGSSAGLMDRFTAQGWDVVAYDSRAQGESTGTSCTYGVYEKRDAQRVIDTFRPGPVVLLGSSLGAAVALQTAAVDARVSGVIAAEVFSDLETVARERAPWFLSGEMIRRAMAVAEARGHFQITDASPLAAAHLIRVPVLLVHGAADRDTLPAHSQRVLSALAGPKRLTLISGAHHNESLRGGAIWTEIGHWLSDLAARKPLLE